jgi:hypothetical protein
VIPSSLVPHPFVLVCAALALLYVAGLVAYVAWDAREHRRAMAPVRRWLATGRAQPDAPAHLMAATDMPPGLRAAVRGAGDLARATRRTRLTRRAVGRAHGTRRAGWRAVEAREAREARATARIGTAWSRP